MPSNQALIKQKWLSYSTAGIFQGLGFNGYLYLCLQLHESTDAH
jgi:hypothetical protein